MRHPVLSAAILGATAVTLMAGCKTGAVNAPAPNGSVDFLSIGPKVAEAGNKVFDSLPGITKVVPKGESDDGMAHVRMHLRIIEAKKDRKLQALPGSWDEALVSLYSATANTATYNASKNSLTIPFGSFTGSGPYDATVTWPPLRPATDYVARVFIRKSGGTPANQRLEASAALTGQTLNAGANTITFTCTLNTEVSNYTVVANSSVANNNTSSNTITKDDTVTLNTGLAASQAGVDRLDIKISGAAYGNPGSPVLIKRFTNANAATWNQYVWNTSVNNNTDTANYVATTLVGGTNQATTAGQLDFEAYDVNGNLAGKASMAIAVHGRPTITIRVQ